MFSQPFLIPKKNSVMKATNSSGQFLKCELGQMPYNLHESKASERSIDISK